MAWVHCALSSFPPSTTTTTTTTTDSKTIIPASLRLTKRKNYLRIKLLKTLTNPNPALPLLPQEEPEEKEEEFNRTLEIQNQEEEEDAIEIEISSDKKNEKGVQDNEQTELDSYEIQISEAGGGIVSNKSVGELVFYFLGMFALQTLCAVWIFRDKNVKKESNFGNPKSEIDNENQKGNFLPNLMGVNDDYKSQMEEIRVLAREVRESEAKKKKLSDSNKLGSIGIGGDENGGKFVKGRTNILKEVDGKLSKLEKRLRSTREKSTTAPLSYLSEQSSKVEEEKKTLEKLNGKVEDERLISKRKKKFRSYYPKLANGENQPKGFQYGKDASKSNGNEDLDSLAEKVQDGNESLDGDLGRHKDSRKEDTQSSTDGAVKKSMLQGNGEVVTELSSKDAGFSQSFERKLGKGESLKRGAGMKRENGKPRSGFNQEATHEVGKPTKSRESKKSTSKEKLRINHLRDNPGLEKNDFWWMKLPYVFAILLRRAPHKDAAKGLYSLKMDESSPSCTVGFEDRRDATNFTYILESFFDDLGGVSADVVPLSMEEIKEAIQSSMKLIVVRKGQLHLYAGQPLGDVETALRTGIS